MNYKDGDYIYLLATGIDWVCRVKAIEGIKLRNKYCISKNSIYNNEETWGNINPGYFHRLATQEERQWLDYCHKQDKFIPLEEAKKHFKLKYIVY